MFIALPFTAGKGQRQPQFMCRRMHQMCAQIEGRKFQHTLQCGWMDRGIATLPEMSVTKGQLLCEFTLGVVSRELIFTDIEGRVVVAQG